MLAKIAKRALIKALFFVYLEIVSYFTHEKDTHPIDTHVYSLMRI